MADNKTSQMIALLGAIRKQMNGAVADAMYYYGADYGLNYGVSLPTIRQIANNVEKDHDLALYLYKQQVRELRLAALHVAKAEEITTDEIAIWAEGVINSEIAEEIAFTLLPRTTIFHEIYSAWSAGESEFCVYAALMAAARSELAKQSEIVRGVQSIIERFPASRIIAQGAVALLAAAFNNEELRDEVKSVVAQAEKEANNSSAASYVAEEMGWRMEF